MLSKLGEICWHGFVEGTKVCLVKVDQAFATGVP